MLLPLIGILAQSVAPSYAAYTYNLYTHQHKFLTILQLSELSKEWCVVDLGVRVQLHMCVLILA